MKLIRFGSLPLVEIRKDEHECLDKYLLKHFSDNISFSNALTNLSIMKNMFYITPASIAETFSKASSSYNLKNDSQVFGKFNNYKNYKEVTKRAFKILKNFYIKLKDAPFYKGMVYYPIYMEKYIGDTSNKNVIKSEYKFNFILLTNDLLNDKFKNTQIDEEAVINALFIFIHIFKSEAIFNKTGGDKSLSTFNKKDLILVMKFYKFIQKYDLNPITTFMAIYDILDFVKKESVNPIKNYNNFSSRLTSRTSKAFNPESETFKGLSKNIAGKITIELQRVFRMGESIQSSEIIVKIIETILEHKEIYDFVENLNENRFSRDSRMQAVADFNHYQSIIKIFENLIEYNQLGLKDIIQNHDINFSKDVVLDGDPEQANITTMVGAIDRKLFETSYKNWQNDCTNFITSTFKSLIQKQLEKENNMFHNWRRDPNYRSAVQEHIETTDKITTTNALISTLLNDLNNLGFDITRRNSQQANNQVLAILQQYDDAQNTLNQLRVQANQLLQQTQAIKNNINAEKNKQAQIITDSLNNNIYFLSNAFGNIFEDLSNIFLNPLILTLFFTHDEIKTDFGIGNQTFTYNCLSLRILIGDISSGKIKYVGKTAVQESSISIFVSMIQQLNTDILYLLDMYLNVINSTAEEGTIDTRLGQGEYNQLRNAFLTNCYNKICSYVFRPMLLKISRVQVHEQNQLMYSNELNDIHPILGKMAKNINNFKSFIFGVTTIETLYDLIVLIREKLFYNGFLNKPTVRLNSLNAKIKYILGEFLNLDQNTVWIVGGGKVRLSMPDYLSVTNVPFLTDIKQSELRKICKIDYSRLWKEDFIGNDYEFISTSGLQKKIKSLEDMLMTLQKDPIKNASRIKQIREEIAKNTTKLSADMDDSIGNIGRNITIEAKKTYNASGGLGDSFTQKVQTVLSEEEAKLLGTSDENAENVITLDHTPIPNQGTSIIPNVPTPQQALMYRNFK